MKYNNELKIIDTQEKAYLLGFLYGDGTITKYTEKSGRIRHLTKISIRDGDSELINSLHNTFPFFNIGEFDFSMYNENSSKQISIAKSSKELYDDLMLNGVYPRKSYENKNKIHLPNIDNKLMSHFIRGFFDADGSVYRQLNRKNLIRIEFCSVCKDFMYELDSYLKNININSWKVRDRYPIITGQICYNLVFTQTAEVLKLIDLMYKDANISLKRKADKCLEYKPVNKIIDRNIICPICGNNKIWVNGHRNKSTRYQCQICFKGFSIKCF